MEEICTCVRTAVDRRPFFPFPFPFPPVKENQDHVYDPGNAYVWYLCFPFPFPPVKEKLDHVYDHGNVKNFPFPPARIKQDHVCDQRKDIEFAAFADYLNACVFICFYRWWLNWESKEPFGGGSFGILRPEPNIRIAWKLNTV